MQNFENVIPPILDYCKEKDISLLCCADNGSRSWGFASKNSDWDIKFLYVHNDKNKYISLSEPKQHTSFKYNDKLECVGYDIKKFLNLLQKGNAQTYELFNSKYFYAYFKHSSRILRGFTNDVLTENIDKVMRHYLGLSYSIFKEVKKNNSSNKLKDCFYVIRSLLIVQYMFDENKLPPLDLNDLLNYVSNTGRMDKELVNDILKLVELRKQGKEIKLNDFNNINKLNYYITNKLEYWTDHLKENKKYIFPKEYKLTKLENFDNMYRKLIGV